MVVLDNPRRVLTEEQYVAYARERRTPYRFDQSKTVDKFAAMVHGLAIFAALTNGRQLSFITTVDEVAEQEAIAASWNPPYRYQGD